jgi:preprotein translocase subunit Sec61beta
MEWFSQKTPIAGIEIPNWVIVVGAAIVIMLILARL